MEVSPKEIKSENEAGIIDRISNLPHSIRCKILAYLPTKNAVAASILSTKWKNIFPFGDPVKLDIDDFLLLHPIEDDSNSPSISFMDFVDRLLNETLSDVPCVEEIVLICAKNYGDAKVVSWVSAALRLNLRYLDLHSTLKESSTLFHSLNGCTTLVSLRLFLKSELSFPKNFSLPKLKRLELNKMIFVDEGRDSINELIEGCPALAFLYLLCCNLERLRVLCIRSDVLKNLVIQHCWKGPTSELILDVPNLELLMFIDLVPSASSVRLSNCLHTVHFNVGPTVEQYDALDERPDDEALCYYVDIVKIVSACSSTVRLFLSSCVIDCLHRTSVQLPVFQNLTWLSLGCLALKWSLLARLLWNAPNLQQLTFEEEFFSNEGEYEKFMNLLPTSPECLVLHVKRIEFWIFKGYMDEFKLVEYFLKHGEVLQKLVLHCLPPHNIGVLTRLLRLPRHSNTCQIECRKK